jgi:hypothetical protein
VSFGRRRLVHRAHEEEFDFYRFIARADQLRLLEYAKASALRKLLAGLSKPGTAFGGRKKKRFCPIG